MNTLAQPVRLAGRLALAFTLVALSAVAIANRSSATTHQPQDPRAIALESLHVYLEQIGWPKAMRERMAPEFLGKLTRSEANQHGGQTVTFDGSRPGLLSTVTLVLDANGKSVVAPAIEIADTTER